MMDYIKPATIEETLLILQNDNKNQVIAGGTDLIPQMRHTGKKADRLVDITAIRGLSYIKEEDGLIRMGALTTHSEVEFSPIIKRKAFVLSAACGAVGCPQIKNKGTLVGNIINASPAADSVVALIALNSKAIISSKKNNRIKKIEDILLGPGKTILQSDELITEIYFKISQSRQGSAFLKIGKRKGMSISIVNCAVVVNLDESMNVFRHVMIVLGSVGPTSIRVTRAEKVLIGHSVNENVIKEASLVAKEEVKPIDDLRSSAEYRCEMTKVLVGRAIWQAVEMARGR